MNKDSYFKGINNKSSFHYSILFFALFIIISLQNILAMIFSKFSKPLGLAIMVVKEIYIGIFIVFFIMVIIYSGKIKTELLIPLIMIIYLISISIFLSPYFNFVSLRQLLVIPLFLLFGYYFKTKISLYKISNWFFKYMIIIVLFAFFERFLLNGSEYAFFERIGVKDWAEMKGWGYNIPGSWYSGDLRLFTGNYYRRMPGILIGDAVNFGQLMVFPLMIASFKKKYLLVLLFLIAVIICLSKGAMIAYLFGISIYFTKEHLNNISKYIFWVLTFVIMLFVIKFSLPYLTQIGSITDHFLGGYTNLISLPSNVWGGGIGSGGNFAKRFFAGNNYLDTSMLAVGESYFGVLTSQLGVMGVLFYFYYPYRLLKVQLYGKEYFLKSVQYSVLGLFFVGLFSETAFTYIGTGIILAFIPMVLHYDKKQSKTINVL